MGLEPGTPAARVSCFQTREGSEKVNTSPGVLGVATRTATRGLGPSAGSETWGPTQPPRAARCSSQDTARPRPRRRDPAPEGRPGSATPPVPGSAHTLLPPCGSRLSASSHLRLDPCFFVVVFAVICLPPHTHLFPACASAGCGGRGVHRLPILRLEHPWWNSAAALGTLERGKRRPPEPILGCAGPEAGFLRRAWVMHV